MVTYRSTISTYVQIIVRDSDGSKRVATLEQDPDNQRTWHGSIDHPSGQKYSVDAYSPDEVDALGKLAQAFVSKEGAYAASKGQRPQDAEPLRSRCECASRRIRQ